MEVARVDRATEQTGLLGKRVVKDQSILGQRLDVRRTGAISIKLEVMNRIILGNEERPRLGAWTKVGKQRVGEGSGGAYSRGG